MFPMELHRSTLWCSW